jgi:hypothetical protein
MPAQGCFVENDQMVQTLATNRADDPLDVRSVVLKTRSAQALTTARNLPSVSRSPNTSTKRRLSEYMDLMVETAFVVTATFERALIP